MAVRRAELFGLPIDALTLDATVDEAERLIETGGPHQHVVLNAAKVVTAQSDPLLRASIEDASIVNVDGQAVVWAARALGVEVPERVAGIDFMDALLARAAQRGWSVYFLGATDDIVARVVDVERARHPGLQVAGWRNGFWSEQQEEDVVAGVAATAPTILLLAMPTPKKEQFAARQLASLGAAFVVGVGGSFDVAAGRTKRAPLWMQRAGLEWFHRLAQEPRRMWRRYLVGNTKFLLLVGRHVLRGRARSDGVFISWIHHHGRSAALSQALGVEARFIATGRRGNLATVPIRYAVQALETMRLLRRERPTVVYVMAPPAPLLLMAVIYGRLCGATVVVDAHTGAVVSRSGRVRRTFLLQARLVRACVVTTEALAAALHAHGVRPLVLHDPPLPQVVRASATKAARPTFVMPCSWYRDEPLDAVRLAAEATPEVDVVLTGRPSGRHADASWPPNVRLAGWLDLDEYLRLIASATGVLALTTRPLTMQRAGYEAMMLGRPAIVSDSEVLTAYFSAGAVVTRNDPRDLREAMLECARREEELAAAMVELRSVREVEFATRLRDLRLAVG